LSVVGGDFGCDGSLNARFHSPTSLSVDSNSGDIYVADYGNHKIRKVSAGMFAWPVCDYLLHPDAH